MPVNPRRRSVTEPSAVPTLNEMTFDVAMPELSTASDTVARIISNHAQATARYTADRPTTRRYALPIVGDCPACGGTRVQVQDLRNSSNIIMCFTCEAKQILNDWPNHPYPFIERGCDGNNSYRTSCPRCSSRWNSYYDEYIICTCGEVLYSSASVQKESLCGLFIMCTCGRPRIVTSGIDACNDCGSGITAVDYAKLMAYLANVKVIRDKEAKLSSDILASQSPNGLGAGKHIEFYRELIRTKLSLQMMISKIQSLDNVSGGRGQDYDKSYVRHFIEYTRTWLSQAAEIEKGLKAHLTVSKPR